MRERSKAAVYRQRENERRRQIRRELKKNKKEEEMRKIRLRSISFETSDNTPRGPRVSIQDYVIRKKVEIIEVTTFIHAKLEETDKENEKINSVL